MSPLVELRGAIPIALGAYQLPVWSAYLFAVLGNLVPLILIILLLDPLSQFLSQRSPLFNHIFSWLYRHTRVANQSKMEKLGKNLAIIILVAIPIPFIGGWTGAMAASVFGTPLRRALPLVVTGCLIGGLIVTFFSQGILLLV